LQHKQLKILQNALELLAPEGRLVYSTCSLERQENEELVELVMAGSEGKYRVLATHRRTPGSEPGDGFFAAVIT
jgi:16S rRNA (cytosine967-C5)-methyltransferase